VPRSSLSVVLVVLGLVGLSILWFAGLSTERLPRVAAPNPALERSSPEEQSVQAESGLLTPSLSSREAANNPSSTSASEREPIVEDEAQVQGIHWIEGRVLLPTGALQEERLVVVAHPPGRSARKRQPWQAGPSANGAPRAGRRASRRNSGEEPVQAEVEPDGSFRLSCRSRWTQCRFELRARHLFLAEEVVKLPAPGAPPVVLRPELGAVLRVRVRLPDGLTDPGAKPTPVSLFLEGEASPPDALLDHQCERSGEVLPGGCLEFTQLPPGSYTLLGSHESLVAWDVPEQVLDPGEDREIPLELGPGVSLSGHVRDEFGRPLRIQVEAWTDAIGEGRDRGQQVISASDGAFLLGGLRPGRVSLFAQRRDCLAAELELGPLSEGSVVNGLELVLRRGNTLAGQARFPDGRGAGIGLELWVEDERDASAEGGKTYRRYSPERRWIDAEGRFTISGLSAGPFRVVAEVHRDGTRFRATARHVPAGTNDLVLAFAEPGALRLVVPSSSRSFRVWDEDGRPVNAGPGKTDEHGTADDGSFEPGYVTIYVREGESHAVWAEAQIRPGEASEVDARPGPATFLEVEVVDGQGNELPATLAIQPAFGPFLAFDSARRILLPDGSYRVRVELEGRRAEEDVLLARGESVELRLVLE